MIPRPDALDRVINAIPAERLFSLSALSLVDPTRQQAAQRLEQLEVVFWILVVALQCGALAWFWRSGRAAAVRDALRRAIPSEFAVRFLYGAIVVALARVAGVLPQFVHYRILRNVGLLTERALPWTGHWLLATLGATIVGGVIASVVLWLVDRTHQWYVYTAFALILGTVGIVYFTPVLFAPITSRYTDLAISNDASPVPVREVHIASRTQEGTAYVEGIGNTERIVVSDTLLASATPAEMRFVLAYELASIEMHAPTRIALAQAFFEILAVAFAVFVADRVGFRRDDDPVSRLSLVGALLVLAYVAAVPAFDAYQRSLDARADTRAVSMTQDPVAGIRHVVRRTDHDLLVVCPSPFARVFLTAHVPPGARIAALQRRPDPCR
jgi:hypothetical protein